MSIGTLVILLSRLEERIFLATKKMIGGKMHKITRHSVQLAAYFESYKSSQLYYQDKQASAHSKNN